MKYIVDDQEYNVEIVRKNNRNTYVRVKDDLTIYVTTSIFTTERQILKVLDSNKFFLKRAIKQRLKQIDDPDYLKYLGNRYYIEVQKLIDDVYIIGSKVFTPSREYLDKWCLKKIKTLFSERYDLYYHKFEEDIPYYKLKFRSMKTRWGVCNKKSGTITLNTKLLGYDVSCLDYVIVHELSHLLEFNHSPNFWKIVEKYCPNYKEIRKVLKH